MPSGSFLYIKLSISCIFYKSVTDGPTDQPTNRPTDQRTDTPSYRDARTHLKTKLNIKSFECMYCPSCSLSEKNLSQYKTECRPPKQFFPTIAKIKISISPTEPPHFHHHFPLKGYLRATWGHAYFRVSTWFHYFINHLKQLLQVSTNGRCRA